MAQRASISFLHRCYPKTVFSLFRHLCYFINRPTSPIISLGDNQRWIESFDVRCQKTEDALQKNKEKEVVIDVQENFVRSVSSHYVFFSYR